MLGAAYSRVSTKGGQVSSTLDYCAERYPALKTRATAALTAWQSRNARYVALAPVLWAELYEIARKDGANAQWREFDEKTMPAMKELARTVLIRSMENATDAQRKAMCEQVLEFVARGKFDITEDPQLVEYLNKRVAEQGSRKSD